MGRHDDSDKGRKDDWTSCQGEDRRDPDSWNDPDIITEVTVGPPVIEEDPDAAQ